MSTDGPGIHNELRSEIEIVQEFDADWQPGCAAGEKGGEVPESRVEIEIEAIEAGVVSELFEVAPSEVIEISSECEDEEVSSLRADEEQERKHPESKHKSLKKRKLVESPTARAGECYGTTSDPSPLALNRPRRKNAGARTPEPDFVYSMPGARAELELATLSRKIVCQGNVDLTLDKRTPEFTYPIYLETIGVQIGSVPLECPAVTAFEKEFVFVGPNCESVSVPYATIEHVHYGVNGLYFSFILNAVTLPESFFSLGQEEVDTSLDVPSKQLQARFALVLTCREQGATLFSLLRSFFPSITMHYVSGLKIDEFLVKRFSDIFKSLPMTSDGSQSTETSSTSASASRTTVHYNAYRHAPILEYPNGIRNRGGNIVTLHYSDLTRLEKGQDLNDNIIDFYLRYLMHDPAAVHPPIKSSCYIFNTHFYRALMKDSLEFLKWTKYIDVFDYDFLLVPISGRSHWTLAIISLSGLFELQAEKPPAILILDSLGRKRPTKTVVKRLERFLNEELALKKQEKTRNKKNPVENWVGPLKMEAICPEVPKQHGDIDCGLYVLKFAHLFCAQPPQSFDTPVFQSTIHHDWFQDAEIPKLRREIIDLIKSLAERQPLPSPLELAMQSGGRSSSGGSSEDGANEEDDPLIGKVSDFGLIGHGFHNRQKVYCYFNAVIQALIALPSFIFDVRGLKDKFEIKSGLITTFLDMLDRYAAADNKAIDLKSLRDPFFSIQVKPAFAENKQQDAHEFMANFLHSFETEMIPGMLHNNGMQGDSLELQQFPGSFEQFVLECCPVMRNFAFVLQETFHCLGSTCRVFCAKSELYKELSLGVSQPSEELKNYWINDARHISDADKDWVRNLKPPLSVFDLLKIHLLPEIIERKCQCGFQRCEVTRKFLHLPRVIVLQLKRFIVSNENRKQTVVKMKHAVKLNSEIDFEDAFCTDTTYSPLACDMEAVSDALSLTFRVSSDNGASRPTADECDDFADNGASPSAAGFAIPEEDLDELPYETRLDLAIQLSERESRKKADDDDLMAVECENAQLKEISEEFTVDGKKIDLEKIFLAELEKQAKESGSRATEFKYSLNCIVAHIGESASSGHYIVYTKNPLTQAWQQFDDAQVTSISMERAISATEKSGYLLFYTNPYFWTDSPQDVGMEVEKNDKESEVAEILANKLPADDVLNFKDIS